MQIDIKTFSVKPFLRNTYAYIEKRFGDKPAYTLSRSDLRYSARN